MVILIFVLLVIYLPNVENSKPKSTFNDSNKLYLVVRVVDGDTIDVKIDDQIKAIRLIGIDSPETVDPDKPIQCFGPEASQEAKKVLFNQKVKLMSDNLVGNKDKYGRLLRYVFLKDGTNFNKAMIQGGYAREYDFKNESYKYRLDFKLAEHQARLTQVGLWSLDSCK